MSIMPFFSTKPRSHVNDPFSTWDPFCDECALISPPHGFFRSKIVPYSLTGPTATTRIHWQETPEAHVLRAELPGLKREEVQVKVEEGRVLKITGEKKFEKEEKHENWHHLEHSQAKFQNAFSLPENSRPDHIKLSFENGVLTVTVPKKDHFKTIHVN